MRFRNIFLLIGGILTVTVLFLSDPDSNMVKNLPFGGGTLAVLITLLSSILYIGLLHLSRKALMDYIDLAEYFKKALQSPEGAGLAIIGVGLIMLSVGTVILAATK